MLKKLGEATANPSVKISEAKFPAPFTSGLEYGAPARGTWNIVHVGMLIPQAHQIFVCAQGCLRGVVLTAAEMGASQRFSTIAVRENNVLDGDMEDLIIDGVSDILERLPEYPPAVLLYTSCIHHFMGSDLDYVYRVLREKYPQVQFTDCYMNPIMRKSGLTPDQTMRRQLYSLLKPINTEDQKKQYDENNQWTDSHDKRIDCDNKNHEASDSVKLNKGFLNNKKIHIAGNDFPLNVKSELYQYLNASGYEICEVAACKTYEEYQKLAECSYNITTFPAAKVAGMYLEKEYGQKHIYLPASFSYEVIDKNLFLLAETLGLDLKIIDDDLEAKKAECEKALQKAKEIIGDTEIMIDFTVFPFVLSLTKLLITHGFHVTKLYTDSFMGEEKEIFEWLKENAPDLEIYPTVHTSMRVLPRKNKHKILAIGQKAAYFSGTEHFVNVVEGGGHWGYEAILSLSDLMCEAYEYPKDTKSLIQIKGMGCGNCV